MTLGGEEKAGTLFVLATPIGNLKDITLRGLEVLKQVGLILAESPGFTKRLLNSYNVKTKVFKFSQHSSPQEVARYLNLLRNGTDIALVSSAGTPGISDPGNTLVRNCLREGIRVTPIPGPCAVTAAYSVSGMASDGFVFIGFLSPKKGKRQKELMEVRDLKRSVVLFESCHRIHETLKDLFEILGNREMVMVREATKYNEEIISGPISELMARLSDRDLKGEITIVVEGIKRVQDDKVM